MFRFQIATIEFCRNVLNIEGANSWVRRSSRTSVVFMPGLKDTHGGKMRLGSSPLLSLWTIGSKALRGSGPCQQTCRHRCEVNPDLLRRLRHQVGIRWKGRDW